MRTITTPSRMSRCSWVEPRFCIAKFEIWQIERYPTLRWVTLQLLSSSLTLKNMNCTLSLVRHRARKLTDDRAPVPQISWIRRRDFHVLTSSTFTYTNDERFQVLHPEGSDDWTLQIKYVQDRDNGTYECQVVIRLIIL